MYIRNTRISTLLKIWWCYPKLQVIFRETYWLRFWAQLQRDEHAKNTLSELSRNIEIIAMEVVMGGWMQNNHLR